MKKILTLISLLAIGLTLGGCSKEKTENSITNGDEIPLTNLAETFEGDKVDSEGNLLAPFDVAYSEEFSTGDFKYDKHALLIKLDANNDGKLTNRFEKCGIKSLELMTTNPNGNWWKAELNIDVDAKIAIQKARSLDEILIADFDYIYETEAINPDVYEDIDDDDILEDDGYLDDCNIDDAWAFLKKEGLPQGGDPSVVVAVIDTGVDYNHPDLKANMWINQNETPNNGIDDDGNGYVDDIYGANTIASNGGADDSLSGNPMDDHGHGTHVAGIIAADNNKIGMVGVAYNAKIMAIKAGQASGIFNQSDIAEAILYAYEMGADVINMSFGGGACSIAVQDALATAYTRSTLVASAGNEGKPNEPADKFPYKPLYMPNYPAALSYVIGVMSVNNDGVESVFSNWDTKAYNKVEYEMYAPGELIYSTLPNNRYGRLSGTSMSAPVVSGVAALLRTYFTDRDMYPSKFIAGQLASTSEKAATCCNPELHTVNGMPHNLPMIVDAKAALTKMPKPDVSLYDYYLFDSEKYEGNNNDGVVDAGETIEIGAILRNRWGMSKDTIITIDANSKLGGKDPYIEILTSNVNYGGVGTYSTKDKLIREEGKVVVGTETPLIVKVAKNCPNDYNINLNVNITYKNGLSDKDTNIYKSEKTIMFGVRNGVVLPSQIKENMTLTSDNYYIIPNSTYIHEGVTVTVEEGTKIQFWSDDPKNPYADTCIAGLNVAGELIMNGSEKNPIEIFPSNLMYNYMTSIVEMDYGYVELNFVNLDNPELEVTKLDHCILKQNAEKIIKREITAEGNIMDFDYFFSIFRIKRVQNCIFENFVNYSNNDLVMFGDFDNCIFNNCAIDVTTPFCSTFTNCVFNGNKKTLSNGEVRKSEIILNQQKGPIDILNVLYNKEKNKIYCATEVKHESVNNYEISRILARKLGGDIACFETEEEYNYLVDNLNLYSIMIGALKSKRWLSGEKISENFIIEGPMTSAIYGRTNLSKHPDEYKKIYFSGGGDSRVLLELDYLKFKKITGISEITNESITKAINLIIEKGLNSQISNCAILNNFNVDSPNELFKITSAFKQGNITIGLSNNYWGTTNIDLINSMIRDFDDYNNLADINLGSFLTKAPENTFPFVVDAHIENMKGDILEVCGNETVKFVIEFNRDMDTTIPLRVRFGSSYPFVEYEINGSYITPRRWEGVYTLKTTIENGNQFLNIENARAKDDTFLTLNEFPGRFMFEIDTTGAQAMLMQGEATNEGIKLTWQQDDFDTLAGYNVYRSEKEDGYYQRINNYVLSANENTLFDDTVEPGKLYYYNFTVVKSDLSESKPSGKIIIMSKDTMAPNIYHTPVYTAFTGNNLVVNATITDNLMIKEAKLYYRVIGETAWKSVTMTNLNDKYSAVIGSNYITTVGLEYYIEATDGVTKTYKGTATNSFKVTVKQTVSDDALGDVDGNGIIEIKDALMILQATNDLLNLTEEQFLRADINKDKMLSAEEALRILKYVNGSITEII